MLFLILIFVPFIVNGCSSLYGRDYKPITSNMLINKPLEIETSIIASGTLETNYYAYITVKNIGSEEVLFDTGDVTLTDKDTGISYFSVSKNSDSVSAPIGQIPLIKNTLAPGQKIKGFILFPTQSGDAGAKSITLQYGSNQIEFK